MSIEFAEKIIDGMVDENGYCGERGLSERQFDILVEHLSAEHSELLPGWSGSRGGKVRFQSTNYAGVIGKYTVVLNEFWHFHRRCTVVEINLRPADEIAAYEVEKAFEAKLREIGRFENSEWMYEEKQRVNMELTLIRKAEYERPAYTYGYETVHIYTLADADGNCYVWKSTGWLDWDKPGHVGSDEYVQAEPGDKVTMRATVKAHDEYRGVKQTVINRPKVKAIEKRAA